MGNPQLKLVAPLAQNGKVTKPPRRRPNSERRTREHLSEAEVEALIDACKGNRHAHRDATLILMGFRHGLRASELVDLRWDQVDFDTATLHVRRAKGGTPSTHDLGPRELRSLRKLQRESVPSQFVFVSERGVPFTTSAIRKLLTKVGEAAGLGGLKIHPHMLRHACGYALINKQLDVRRLQRLLGHKNVRHTIRYAELSPAPFRNLWDD
jgi:type 1 fimbriae regulatory protein FimB/type 1 fimbriae regulatory protein FimE